MQHDTEWLTAQELADRLRVSPETIREWSRRGVIPRLWLSAKVIRYDLSEVLSAISQSSSSATDRRVET